MTTPPGAPVPPVKLTADPVAGRLSGSNGRYEKHLADLNGIYRDAAAYDRLLAADDGAPVYWVEASETEDGPGGLITGISVLEPGRVGDEFFMTRGHLHARADRSEVYTCLAGQGVMLLETVDGRSEAIEMSVGDTVYVPGHWVHRSVNVGSTRFVTMFIYPADAGQDYGLIHDAGGMKNLVVSSGDGWTTRANTDHEGYRA
ncbi:glucose-6-phosphate isomerase family protein [Nocardioides sp. SYSU D00065]|uniref:glucose-6-phosphate isomerase family protein n=1 Tax=Nocardioides sp. SYSU D00065 TaxID=2817378 RepID=UPI001B33E7D8|nr:glucose-6-phosphate isomerase family protein [Nocardioides sp. SYSU D00065]